MPILRIHFALEKILEWAPHLLGVDVFGKARGRDGKFRALCF
ncbi:uncharacterized protein G2W53_034552 [Senna tora]|uniref:Uncharacterized protein n=1 Tax=Senna tora TaxID=362788 RepID=A0A834WC12_9FABA|nr:uncharacterized protein G2W53_034552 [Senna tora]